MNIAIIGCGYVGLVTGACFAEFGGTVRCVDNDTEKVRMLNRGEIPFYEPNLSDMVSRNIREGRLGFSTDMGEAVRNSLVIFIAVGTPPRDDGSADLCYVFEVAREIAKHIDIYKVIATKSTVPVGTGRRLRELIAEGCDNRTSFDIVSNPEFLREGAAIDDFMRPDRVVIGAESRQAISIMKDLYRPLYLIETPFVITNIETSELIKYASNAFLATKISFINEMANLCELLNADVHDVARAMGLDGRIGKKFLHPGPGYGGSCFPKDTRALLTLASEHSLNLNIISATINTNDRQRERMLQKILNVMGEVSGRTIAFLGLSFKPNTDDIREAPSLFLIDELLKRGANIKAFDPVSINNARKLFDTVHYANDLYDVFVDADAVVLITEWNQFRNLDMPRIKALVKTPLFFDLRNVYEPAKMKELGFSYYAVGRLSG
ncbi:MAG: UDP-glucose/GDP-mannose dehydrogenase family protein [Nitrospirae bacterium]|uniref:UDP-glucose dehydrogenase family protein n=1 Tax=Candidatus Magnetobacterium casense TaxID=1455061 RepID=UPI00058F3CA5|nr:UDP-glucose/GDP-mannose dehydrogenase family protein [Candidatus Magnetobacterium casensis]MBF0338243.1 UDP-glucose/GDP-mannose dehydrogenase family protein [Nitrospirota bacterium]